MNSAWQSLRYGFRSLTNAPAFSAAAILALALGIGTNTTIFSLVHAVLLAPLPFRDTDRLVNIWTKAPKQGYPKINVAAADYLDWQQQSTVFDDMALVRGIAEYNLSGERDPERLQGARVSASFFPVLGVSPMLGRAFSADEAARGDRLVVLSYGLWQRRFGGDPKVVGRTIRLNAEPYVVAGVMPPQFQYPTPEHELWAPLVIDLEEIKQRLGYDYLCIARLRPGMPVSRAQAEMDAIMSRISKKNPIFRDTGAIVTPLREELTGNFRTALVVLAAAVGFVLLIACANIANLLLARATARDREFTLRLALGASRARIVSQLLTEIVPLLLVGSGLGLLLALWGVSALTAYLPIPLPPGARIAVNSPVLLFAVGVTSLAGLVFGLAPALQTGKMDLADRLREGARSAGGLRNLRFRNILVISELALATVLLVGAGLLIRSFEKLREVNSGIQPAHVLSMQIALPPSKYAQAFQVNRFYRQLLERIRALPGVEYAGMVNRLPLGGVPQTGGVTFEGGSPAVNELSNVDWRTASPGYFQAIGIPLKRGRFFSDADMADSPRVGLIDEQVARRVWPNQDPLGKRFRLGTGALGQPWNVVVGVVGHVRHDRLDLDRRPQVYWNYQQRLQPRMALAIRTAGDPLRLASAIQGQVREVDPDQPVYNVRTMEDVVFRSVSQRWFNTVLLGIFAGLATLLASIGVYGVMSYLVSQRTREIGVRMALGARQADVLRQVMRQVLTISLIGLGIGLMAALGLSRWLSSLLYGISTADPVTMICAAVILPAVAVIASYVPARRAAAVDPMIALRYD